MNSNQLTCFLKKSILLALSLTASFLLFFSTVSFAVTAEKTELMIAASKGDVAEISRLLDKGVDVNEINDWGFTALIYALEGKRTEAVKKLLEKGADPNGATISCTAVDIAAYLGNDELVKLLLAKGAIGNSQVLTKFNLGLYATNFYSEKELEKKPLFKNFAISFRSPDNSPNRGFTRAWLLDKWLGGKFETLGLPYEPWFEDKIKSVNNWDGKAKPDAKKAKDFEELAYIVDFLDNKEPTIDNQEDLIVQLKELASAFKKEISEAQLDAVRKEMKSHRALVKKFTIALTLNSTSKQTLSNLLRAIVHDNRLIEIVYKCSPMQLTYFFAGIFKHGKDYYYGDSSDCVGEIKIESIDILAETILKYAKLYNTHNPATAVAFNVYSSDDDPHTYPDPKEFLDKKISIEEAADGLRMSAHEGAVDSLLFFLDHYKVDPNVLAPAGGIASWTPLMYASENGRLEAATKLIEKGADPNTADALGFTPLMLAAKRGQSEVVTMLLEKGADPKKRVTDGYGALDLAMFYRHTKCVDILRNYKKKEL